MTRLVLLSFSLLLFSYAYSQDEDKNNKKDTWTTPIVTDEMTMDADQNKMWRSGEYAYSAKPKNALELGIDVGHAYISGDVDRNFPFGGYSIGAHLRKSINYIFSVKFSGNYNQVKGFDARKLPYSTFRVEKAYSANPTVFSQYQDENNIHRNYKTSVIGGDIQGIVNVGNLLFHKHRNKWNLDLGAGMGFYSMDVKTNLLNGNNIYDFSKLPSDVSTKENRKQIRKDLKDLLDDDFETKVPVRTGRISIGDDTDLRSYAVFSGAIMRKFTKRFNLGLEHQVIISDNDQLDGYLFRTQYDESTEDDVLHNTRLVFNFNLGNFNKRTEPLYWLNPISGTMDDIAALKERPVLDLTDTDGDGVIDMLDIEPGTPEGCPVNTKGIAIDSDGDGFLDCDDWETFTAPGLEVDEHGVGIVPEPDDVLTEPMVEEMINRKMANIRTTWFLPMIHFDLDKYRIKPEFYGQLHHVAEVMAMNPSIRVVARGFADNRKDDGYNAVLSYERAESAINYLVSKYGIDRSRFVLQYEGETDPLISGLPDNHNISKHQEMEQYMNRRVEFVVATGGETDMARPAGSAGSNTPGSSRSGSKYSGTRK